jgi:hypothetical protein
MSENFANRPLKFLENFLVDDMDANECMDATITLKDQASHTT